MTDHVTRARWRHAVEVKWIAAYSRPTKSTLLSICHLMTASGELLVTRQEMHEATGIPTRTIDRHLATACDLGWLTRVSSGHRGAPAIYRASLPVEAIVTDIREARKARHSRASNGANSAPHTRTHPKAESAPVGGALNKDHAKRSERVAVDLPVRGGNGVLLVLRRDHRTQPARVLGGELRQSKPDPRTHADHAHDSGPLLADFDLGSTGTAPHEAGLRFAREVS